MLDSANSIWRYRGFIIGSIRNEFTSKFSRSLFGTLWLIIHPLTQVAIYSLIFSNIIVAKLPNVNQQGAYALYLMAGTLAWSLFVDIIQRCLTLFLDQANLIKKMRFPKITLPIIAAGSAIVSNLFLLASILTIFTISGNNPHWELLWLPVLMMPMVMIASGLGLIAGILNVFLRDVGQVVPVVLQILFWLTPIVYPISVIPQEMQPYLRFNPMTFIVEGYQAVLVYGHPPDLRPLGFSLLAGCLLLALGLLIYRRASGELVDAL